MVPVVGGIKLPVQKKGTAKKGHYTLSTRVKVRATHTIVASQWDERSVDCAEVTASKLYFGHHTIVI
jgi:hypothetical protein